MTDKALTSRKGALWIQPNGPSPINPVYLLGCHDLGDLTIPEGDISPLRCFKSDGTGWDVIGETTAPPDMPSTSVDTLLMQQRDWLEKLGPCAFSLYALARDCGDASVFDNYVRGEILTNARMTERTYSGLAKREEDVEMTLSVPIKGWAVLDVDDLHADLVAHASIVDQNDVIANTESRCLGDCGDALDIGQDVYTVTDGAGAAKPEVYLSTDEGQILKRNGVRDVHWTVQNGKRVALEALTKAMGDTTYNATQGIGGGFGMPSFNLMAADGQPHDVTAEQTYIDERGLTQRARDAYKALGWTSSKSWYLTNGFFAPSGLSTAVYIDPASDFGKTHTKMVELRVKYTSKLVLANSDAEFEAVWQEAMAAYEKLKPEEVIAEYNRLIGVTAAKLQEYRSR